MLSIVELLVVDVDVPGVLPLETLLVTKVIASELTANVVDEVSIVAVLDVDIDEPGELLLLLPTADVTSSVLPCVVVLCPRVDVVDVNASVLLTEVIEVDVTLELLLVLELPINGVEDASSLVVLALLNTELLVVKVKVDVDVPLVELTIDEVASSEVPTNVVDELCWVLVLLAVEVAPDIVEVDEPVVLLPKPLPVSPSVLATVVVDEVISLIVLLDVELNCDVNDSELPTGVVELETPLVLVLVLAPELLPIVAIDSSEVPTEAVDVVCGLVVLASVVVELLGVEDDTEVNASVLGSGVVDADVEGVLLPVLLLISVVISAEVMETTTDDVS